MSQTVELTQISTRVDGEQLRRLDEKCAAERRSRSFVLGEALQKHLADDEATRSDSPVTSEAGV